MNRVLNAYREWDEREQKLAKEVPDGIRTRKFQQEKFDALQKTILKYSASATAEEKVTIVLLQGICDRIAPSISRGRVLNLVDNIVGAFRRQREVKADIGAGMRADQDLLQRLSALKLNDAVPEAQRMLEAGHKEFAVRYSHFVTDKEEIHYRIDIVRNAQGFPQVKGVMSSVNQDGNPEALRQHYFRMDAPDSIDAARMYDLLVGRSIQLQNENWIKLDANDRDELGNNKMKVFPSNYGVDVEAFLHILGVARDPDEQARAIRSLKNSGTAEVLHEMDGRVELLRLTVDPQPRRLKIEDAEGKAVPDADVRRMSRQELKVDVPKESPGRSRKKLKVGE